MDYRKTALEDYIKEIASRKISPGGGSASALSAAIGAALNLMVINFGISPKACKDKVEVLTSIKKQQTKFMDDALSLINEDCVVFTELMSAILNRSDTQEKYASAAEVPMKICRLSRESMAIASKVLDLVSGYITADIACARDILFGAFSAAQINVEMNLKGMGEASASFEKEIADLRRGIDMDVADINGKLHKCGIVKGA